MNNIIETKTITLKREAGDAFIVSGKDIIVSILSINSESVILNFISPGKIIAQDEKIIPHVKSYNQNESEVKF